MNEKEEKIVLDIKTICHTKVDDAQLRRHFFGVQFFESKKREKQ